MNEIRIMIVDDKPFFVRHLKNEVAKADDRLRVVYEAYSAQQALEEMHAFLPDVALIDIEMPGMDGLSLIDKLKERYPQLVCIVVSGYQDFKLLQRALRVKADDYLLKPVKAEEINTVLSRYTEGILSRRGESDERESGDNSYLVIQIEQYLAEHIHSRLSVDDLCKTFHLSTSKLCRIFKKYRNDSVMNYFTRMKMECAKKMLAKNPELLVSELSVQLGFDDSLYFGKVFKRFTGYSPNPYKAQILRAEESENETKNT